MSSMNRVAYAARARHREEKGEEVMVGCSQEVLGEAPAPHAKMRRPKDSLLLYNAADPVETKPVPGTVWVGSQFGTLANCSNIPAESTRNGGKSRATNHPDTDMCSSYRVCA